MGWGRCWLGWDRVALTSREHELGKAPVGSPQALFSVAFLPGFSIQALYILLISDTPPPQLLFLG